jgi:hypothetical protein
MPRFAKPPFERLVANYHTERESVHACPFLYKKESLSPTINTCALRISEALVIANGLVENRDAITAITNRPERGRAHLLGLYGYRANLCPHGIGRGARDVSDFLRQQWGSPSYTWSAQPDASIAPSDVQGLTGVMAFVKLPGYTGQGHIDLWNRTAAIGHAYWNAEKIYLWRLD